MELQIKLVIMACCHFDKAINPSKSKSNPTLIDAARHNVFPWQWRQRNSRELSRIISNYLYAFTQKIILGLLS